MIDRVAVLGVGLIGGSVALALRERGECREIVGYDRAPETLELARALGVIDRGEASVAGAVAGAELIMIAVPVLSAPQMLAEIHAALWREGVPDPAPVITDVGSVKSSIVAAAREMFGGTAPPSLVPGHPIAGSERHGVEATRADLFEKHRVILTPVEETDSRSTELVSRMWEALGAEVVAMEVAHHDEVLAGTSHLPHLLAYALVDTLSGRGDSLEIFRYAAGGFRDFSRIAASDPTMWRDIFTANASQVIAFLDRYMGELEGLRQAMAAGEMDYLIEVFARAKEARDHFSALEAERAERGDSAGDDE